MFNYEIKINYYKFQIKGEKMLLLNLKSMLRNKSNLIYIIVIIITFIFLNIALASSNLLDCYYENRLIELSSESILEDLNELI